MSSPPEILSDQKIFHRWQPYPFEYVLVCHFVLPGYPHDRTQMSHHEDMHFFTCRLYTVQAMAPYRRVDSTIARYILPLTRIDTWWLFQSIWCNRPKDAIVLAILPSQYFIVNAFTGDEVEQRGRSGMVFRADVHFMCSGWSRDVGSSIQ